MDIIIVVTVGMDDLDICYCHKCRPITINENFKYFKDKYNEELTIEQIRKIILE